MGGKNEGERRVRQGGSQKDAWWEHGGSGEKA